MDAHKNLIIVKGKVCTASIAFCKYNLEKNKYNIRFNNGKFFSYNPSNVDWISNPIPLNPAEYQIWYDDKKLFDIQKILVFKNKNYEYWHLCFANSTERDYQRNNLTIKKSCLKDIHSKKVFDYLKEVANYVSICAEDGTNLLSKQYEKISFVNKTRVIANYLNPSKFPIKNNDSCIPIFPFGCNASQYEAVKKALENQMSVIEGPPGTGKTQTILNIIANLLINHKTVLVCSNNNSATANILEKLSSQKYGMDFLVAALGNTDNKNEFIHNQTGFYPSYIQSWNYDIGNKKEFLNNLHICSEKLAKLFVKQEELAVARKQLREIDVEYKYFEQYSNTIIKNVKNLSIKKDLDPNKILQILNVCQNYADKGKQLPFIFKIKCCFIYGIGNWAFYKKNISLIITQIQILFYTVSRLAISKKIDTLEKVLLTLNHKKLLADLILKSMQYLKSNLYHRYGKSVKRKVFENIDLWKNSIEVQKEYPVVLSTTYSTRSSLGKDTLFDYVIMDEASQVDVATGALALSSAKNAVIVGDTKQLPNVVTKQDKIKLQAIFDSYCINSGYNFAESSFLQSVCTILPQISRTLLREHYRCHPQIINFCNQKFYDGKLIIMTEDNGEKDVISVTKTVVGNHERDHMNQRQADVIKQEILPAITSTDSEIGIIAPYKKQVEILKGSIDNKQIDIDTVHKFQGREKDTIIITTVDDVVTDFSDDPYLLNVAISRAKRSLHLVVSGNEQPVDSNIGDLINYIEYNNFTVKESSIYSVFDFLYSQYSENRMKLLKNRKKISKYDSENLMYMLIKDVLHKNGYFVLNVICHQPLKMLIRDTSLMNEKERLYAMRSGTHLDFLIYNKISKKPVIAIEVDGFKYHKEGTKQAERDALKNHILELYKIPLLRFATNGSGEREKLLDKLKELMIYS